jgi:protein-disulfide isomerase
MLISRRHLFAGTALAASAALGTPARAQAQAQAENDLTRAERFIGKPTAKVTVDEYFSLTCTHCAAFAKETLPDIQKNLIDTGVVRWVFHDYPLDQIALTAAMIARYLPVDRYEPFINALFASQMQWAFSRGSDPTDELWKFAGLAGMGRPTFDKAIADTGLRDWILTQQKNDTTKWNIDSTPSFVINGKKYAGEMSYDAFKKLIPA